MSDRAFAYVDGSAGRGRTNDANVEAFGRYRAVPRMLRDVRERDLGVDLFGRRYAHPLLLAPIGVLEMAHPQAERAVAKASVATQTPMIHSTQASVAMEEVAARTSGDDRTRAVADSKAAGDVVTVAYLLTIVSFPIRSIGWVLGEVPRSVVSWERVEAVLDAHPAVEEAVVFGVPVPGVDGKAGMAVELRPRAGSDPFKVARIWVYEHTK